MPGEGAYKRAGLGIPDSYCAIVTPICQGTAIRTERYAQDPTRMPREGAYGRAGLGIPHSHRGVAPTPSTCQCVSVRTVRYACDRTRMPGEGAYKRAGLGIPDSHRAIRKSPLLANVFPSGLNATLADPTPYAR